MNKQLYYTLPETRQFRLSSWKHNPHKLRSFKYQISWLQRLLDLVFSNYSIHGNILFKDSNRKLTVLVFVYKDDSRFRLLENSLSKIAKSFNLGKPLEIKVLKLRYPYLNAEILAKYLANYCKKNSLRTLTSRFLNRKVSCSGIFLTSETDNDLCFKYLNGLDIELRGRMSKRRTANRTNKQSHSIGSLHSSRNSHKLVRNHNKANVDYSKYSTKNKNGGFTMKVWLSAM